MNLKEKMSSAIKVTDELLLNVPITSVIGNNEFTIENYKGIVLYSENKIRINTSIGIVTIVGDELALSKVLAEKISIKGSITEISFSGI